MKLSQIPIRAAIQRLQAEGLVIISPHASATVAPLPPEKINEVFALLESLERVAFKIAAKDRTEADLNALTDLVRQMDTTIADHHPANWLAYNSAFHRQIAAIAAMPLLVDFTNRALDEWERISHHYFANVTSARLPQAQAEHHQVIALLRARDADALEVLAAAHNRAANRSYQESSQMNILPHRKITGYSAILLPFRADGAVDWDAFCAHVARTAEAGLTPAVNMDTGYVNLIDEQTQCGCSAPHAGYTLRATLHRRSFCPRPGRRLIRPRGLLPSNRVDPIFRRNPDHLPILRPDQPPLRPTYRCLRRHWTPSPRSSSPSNSGTMFAPFGKIYDLATYEGLLGIKECIGAKHSSLSRELEWERLALRDKIRPDFKVFTGNDLAIDMVMYGSDYLLGLSTFAPDYFRPA